MPDLRHRALDFRKNLQLVTTKVDEAHQVLRDQAQPRTMGNWYLAAWCYLRKEMRSFAMDAIKTVVVLSKPAKEISRRELDGFVGKGYGIYSGPNVRWAKMRFSAVRARWVSREQWHPLQRSLQEDDGSLLLEVPFTDMRELAMDILRQGQHVEVLEPPELRAAVKAELKQALSQYSSKD